MNIVHLNFSWSWIGLIEYYLTQVILNFTATNYRCNGKDANTQTKSKISNEEMMKVMMECLEDIQADYNEAKQINDSMIHDFLEEMQVRHYLII